MKIRPPLPTKSKYRLKVEEIQVPPKQHRKPKRTCTQCRGQLAGKKGHGFPSASGRTIFCGSCKK